MVYAIAVESLERRVNNDLLAAALINALGGEASAPNLGEVQREFDEWLLSEPDAADGAGSPEAEWRQVMGVSA